MGIVAVLCHLFHQVALEHALGMLHTAQLARLQHLKVFVGVFPFQFGNLNLGVGHLVYKVAALLLGHLLTSLFPEILANITLKLEFLLLQLEEKGEEGLGLLGPHRKAFSAPWRRYD